MKAQSYAATSTWRRTKALALGILVAGVVVAGGSGARGAETTVTFNDFSDLSTMQLNGNTATNGNPVTNAEGAKVLRLTMGLNQAGTAFLKDTIPLEQEDGFKASFSTKFEFQITRPVGCFDQDGQGADGITFIVQTVSNTAGGFGGGIGYLGLQNSVAAEFDTWNNGPSFGDPDGNHVAIDTNGAFDGTASAVAPRMNDGAIWDAWVDYNGDTQDLELRVARRGTSSDPAPARPAAANATRNVDLPTILGVPDAFVGFGSGTGCAGGDHDILNWVFTNTYQPIDTNDPPDCSTVTAGPSELWPPNHEMREVTVGGATDPDGKEVTLSITGVTQDEAVPGPGEGHGPDADLGGDNDADADIRAERDGGGDGRVYVISVTGDDGQGGTCRGTATVSVPHDQSGDTVVDSGQDHDSTVNA